MNSVKCAISKHTSRVLSKMNPIPETNKVKCNCRKKTECPMKGNCLAAGVIYQAEVTSASEPTAKRYIGMTSNSFKLRYNNHQKSFNDQKYSNFQNTFGKGNDDHPVITLRSILKRATPYTAGSARCNLCLEEKLQILKANKENLLNKKAEMVSKCRHESKFYAKNLCRGKNNVRRRQSTSHSITTSEQSHVTTREELPDDRATSLNSE